MTKFTEPTADVGVIIGRFQVAELHAGHYELIEAVRAKHRKVVVLLGMAPVAFTRNNPLDFESRKQMITWAYPEITVLYVRDVPSDDLWSKEVDRTITDVLSPMQSALLYGSRDSFITSYNGRFDTVELPPHHEPVSGTMSRLETGRAVRPSADWRAGVIWASRNRYPVSYQTVDIAIFKPDYSQLLMAFKTGEDRWRLPGGFADPDSDSLEADAIREAKEETGCTPSGLHYIKSLRVPDWRYRGEPDCIKTALFVATTTDDPVADDDIVGVRWFDLSEIDPTNQHRVLDIHRPLVTAALMRARTIGSGC